MKINWFPGHMSKALSMMEKELKVVDVVVYVLDARAPFSCVNPSFESIIGNKPIIYVLNKYDLANSFLTKQWQQYFTGENKRCVLLNSTESGSAKVIKDCTKTMLIKKLESNRRKNINIPLRMIVIGVPNSGKSTLINNLCGKGKTVTGDRPGVTRGKQWIRIDDGLEVLDTPGTLWPNFDNERVANNLAYIGSIKEEVLDVASLALEFISDMINIDKKMLENRYSIEIKDGDTPIEIYERICKSRGYILRNHEFDYDRCAHALLDDFRKGRLGKLTLDIMK